VLKAVPDSKLLLKTSLLNTASLQEQTCKRFAQYGITSNRLILEGSGGLSRAEFLSTYNRIDIALDPFPYAGCTTSIESLWMGVPVLTKQGDRFLSHVGETIAHNAGLPKWIAADEDDYVAKAVVYAADLNLVSALRAGLRQQVLGSTLFDAARFAGHFEQAMHAMWSHWQEQDHSKI
jgi:predicted O-linked N-acetylglucosamine transferase (SPINDLY family)